LSVNLGKNISAVYFQRGTINRQLGQKQQYTGVEQTKPALAIALGMEGNSGS
jgi:hypothetical protein